MDFYCDRSRPGGYCTAPCRTPDDCSAQGPEICAPSRVPSFALQASANQHWCLLGWGADADCRNAEGYRCTDPNASAGAGTCDAR